jgi:hypothetical protein
VCHARESGNPVGAVREPPLLNTQLIFSNIKKSF